MFIVVIAFRRCRRKAVKYWDKQCYESFQRILWVYVLAKTSGARFFSWSNKREWIKSRTATWSLDVLVMLCICPHFRSLVIHNMWCQWTLWPHTEPMQRCLQELQPQCDCRSWRDSPRHSDLESTSNQHIQVREPSLIVVIYLCIWNFSKLQIHARHIWNIIFRSLARSTWVLLLPDPVISSLRFLVWKMQLFGEREKREKQPLEAEISLA